MWILGLTCSSYLYLLNTVQILLSTQILHTQQGQAGLVTIGLSCSCWWRIYSIYCNAGTKLFQVHDARKTGINYWWSNKLKLENAVWWISLSNKVNGNRLQWKEDRHLKSCRSLQDSHLLAANLPAWCPNLFNLYNWFLVVQVYF